MRTVEGAEALRLRLYVAGDSPNSVMAITNLRALLADLPSSSAGVEIIDILADPERCLRDGVLMTPMLLKLAPPPERRILGNLRDRWALLRFLGLDDAPVE